MRSFLENLVELIVVAHSRTYTFKGEGVSDFTVSYVV